MCLQGSGGEQRGQPCPWGWAWGRWLTVASALQALDSTVKITLNVV